MTTETPPHPTSRPMAPNRRIPWLALLPLILFAALAILFASRLLLGGDAQVVPSVLIGRPTPVTPLAPLPGMVDEAGEPVPAPLFGPASQGQVRLVNFWASWCAPCRAEHPVLMALAAREGLELVGVAYKDEPDRARAFLDELGNPFDAIGLDPEGRAALEWGVAAAPETFLIAADGTVLFRHQGALDRDALNRIDGATRHEASPTTDD